MLLTNICIYTIKHSDDLRAAVAKGGRDTYREGKRWARAQQLLHTAQRSGQRLPIIFAPAEDTIDVLFGWALLHDVVLEDRITVYSFSELTPFTERRLKTALRKASDAKPLAKWFIRPYAICHTPPWLVEGPEAGKSTLLPAPL